jgi:hypothetical protein
MRRPVEIREIRHDDLRGVFLLGSELLPPECADMPVPWDAGSLAGVLADGMDHSFVAAKKKTVEGFLVGRLTGAETAEILWTCARGREAAALLENLYHAFTKSLPPAVTRIRVFSPSLSVEMSDFFGKFGFTLSKHVVIMENFFRKNS